MSGKRRIPRRGASKAKGFVGSAKKAMPAQDLSCDKNEESTDVTTAVQAPADDGGSEDPTLASSQKIAGAVLDDTSKEVVCDLASEKCSSGLNGAESHDESHRANASDDEADCDLDEAIEMADLSGKSQHDTRELLDEIADNAETDNGFEEPESMPADVSNSQLNEPSIQSLVKNKTEGSKGECAPDIRIIYGKAIDGKVLDEQLEKSLAPYKITAEEEQHFCENYLKMMRCWIYLTKVPDSVQAEELYKLHPQVTQVKLPHKEGKTFAFLNFKDPETAEEAFLTLSATPQHIRGQEISVDRPKEFGITPPKHISRHKLTILYCPKISTREDLRALFPQATEVWVSKNVNYETVENYIKFDDEATCRQALKENPTVLLHGRCCAVFYENNAYRRKIIGVRLKKKLAAGWHPRKDNPAGNVAQQTFNTKFKRGASRGRFNKRNSFDARGRYDRPPQTIARGGSGGVPMSGHSSQARGTGFLSYFRAFKTRQQMRETRGSRFSGFRGGRGIFQSGFRGARGSFRGDPRGGFRGSRGDFFNHRRMFRGRRGGFWGASG